MEALLDLREGLGTHLADKRERSKRKDRPICDEIRVPSEVLWQGNGRHIREIAAAASWHPRGRKRTAAITSTAPRAFYEKRKTNRWAYHRTTDAVWRVKIVDAYYRADRTAQVR